MSSDAPRERPQYGEYATYDEQQALIQHVPAAAPAVAPVAPAAPTAPTPRPRTADRIVTVALLVFGLVNVATTVPALIDYSGYVDTFLGTLGVSGELADPAAGRAWGIAAALVLIVGLVSTAFFSRLSLLRGRVTFWIPLVGAIVFTMASAFLAVVPIMNDPALWSAIQSALL